MLKGVIWLVASESNIHRYVLAEACSTKARLFLERAREVGELPSELRDSRIFF